MGIFKSIGKNAISNKLAFIGLLALITTALFLYAYTWRDSNIGSKIIPANYATCYHKHAKFAYYLKLNLPEKSNLSFNRIFVSQDCEDLKSKISNNDTTAEFFKGNGLIIKLSIENQVIYEKSKSPKSYIFIAFFIWGLLMCFFYIRSNMRKI